MSATRRGLGTGLILAAALLALAGCGGEEAAPGPARAAPDLETLVVQPAAIDRERVFDGIVESVEQATLAAQTSGRIVALERDVDDRIRRGDLMMRISAVEQRARLDAALESLSEAKALATEARAQFRRVSDLVERKLLSQADLDRVTAVRDAAAARLAAAEASVAAAREQFSYTEIRAPFAGVVTRRHVDVGEAVSPGTPLVAIAAPDVLRVNVDVPQALAEEVRGLGAATVRTGEREVPSERITVFPAASAGSNTVRVRIDLPAGTPGLFPGMFVKAGFAIGDLATVRVPASVVVRRGEVTAVYVVTGEGRIVLRQVRLGRALNGTIEVLAGLEPGERVAADPVAATLAVEGR